MNFRHTALLFGICLGMLWLFGLMLAYKKVAVDESYIVPTLQKADDLDVDTVLIERKLKDKDREDNYTFYKINDYWFLKDGEQNIRVEGFRIKDLVRDIQNLKKNENASVSARDLAFYELKEPYITVTIKGKLKKRDNKEMAWKFHVGMDSVDKLIAYVNSSDRPDRVFGVDRAKIEGLYFKDANALRSKRLFDFGDTSVTGLSLKQAGVELELAKADDGVWRITKPALGFADYEGTEPKLALPGAKSETGVKGLIYSITRIQVEKEEDFLPPRSDLALLGLEDGKESIRIQVTSLPEKDKKEPNKETLLIGRRIEKTDQYYARLLIDQGAFKINAKYLETVLKDLKEPGQLRSLDLLQVEAKKVDYLTLLPGGPEIKLYHPDGKEWLMQQAKDKVEKANPKAVEEFLEALQGKKQIQKFIDVVESEAKKTDDQHGLTNASAEVNLYVDAIEKEKKDEKKDDKIDPKKVDKKDDKKDELPNLVKDSKAAVKLIFGKVEGENVYVKRVLADGTISRFAVPKALLDRVRPPDARLAFLTTTLPEFDTNRVVRLDIQRGSEKLQLELVPVNFEWTWAIKGSDPTGPNALERFAMSGQILRLAKLSPKKWVKVEKLAAKDDLEQWGLAKPSLTVTLGLQKIDPRWAASATGLFAQASTPWGAASYYLAHLAMDKGETVTFKFGKETVEEKDKPGVFAQYSGSDLIFLVAPDEVKALREFDPRNKDLVMNFQPSVDAGLALVPILQPASGLMLVSPLATNQVMSFDPAQVKAIKLAVRTPDELRNFTFQKHLKDKTWTDQSGLQEFNLDADKVNKLVEELAKFKADRLISFGGARPDHKLSPIDATLRIEIFMQDGKAYTLAVGGQFERNQYFAHSTAWPEVVFFLNTARVEPFLRGASFFAKERVAAGAQ